MFGSPPSPGGPSKNARVYVLRWNSHGHGTGPVLLTRLAALERRTVHVTDMTVEPGFSPMVLQYERARTVLAVPLLRETNLVGVITIWRRPIASPIRRPPQTSENGLTAPEVDVSRRQVVQALVVSTVVVELTNSSMLCSSCPGR